MMIIVLLIAVVAIFTFIGMQPGEFRISRSASITASPQIVFEQVNDLHLWNAWSPWARLDPASVSTYEGPQAGAGAVLRWNGNRKIGQGSMTITDNRPYESIHLRLEFLRPFVGNNKVEFIFTPEGPNTVVTWSSSGTNNFMGKAMGMIMNCEKMIGGQYEKGLANLKAIAEGATP